jgi:hypothetical protein
MQKRCKARDNCIIEGGWESFEVFKVSAIAAGWTIENKLYVLRKGDVGNYSPTNAYFGTASDNAKDMWRTGCRT